MGKDLHYAIRSLTRAKRLVAVLVLSLGCGIGVNVAVGRALYAVLFRAPAGVSDPASLVSLYTSQTGGGTYGPSSYREYERLRSGRGAFVSVAAIDDRTIENVGLREGESGQARVAAVSDSFFAVLGMEPSIGRLLAEGDAARQPRPAVLSHARWQALGGDPALLHQTLMIGSDEYIVVGVAPPGFHGLQAGRITDVWVPLIAPGERSAASRVLAIVARLAPGAAVESAARAVSASAASAGDASASDASASAEASEERQRATAGFEPGVPPPAPRTMSVVPYTRLDPENRRRNVFIGAVIAGTLVLLLASACVNAASLLLSRAAARRTEAAILLALGSSRGQLVLQALAQSLIIALAAATLGLLFASWMTTLVPLLFTADQTYLVDAPLDVPLVALIFAIAAAAGVAIGSAAAFSSMSVLAVSLLRGDSGAISPKNTGVLRVALVTCQIALSIILLVMTGALRGSLHEALNSGLGTMTRQVAVVAVQLPGGALDPARGRTYQQSVEQSLRKHAQIHNVGWASTPPLQSGTRRQFTIEDERGIVEAAELDVNVVSPSYFGTLKLTRIEGRLFTADDQQRPSPVVVVDQQLATRYFNGRAAGRFLHDAAGTRYEIIGTVVSPKYRTLQESPQPTVYVPHTREHVLRPYLFVQTRVDPAPMLAGIRSALERLDTDVVVIRAATLQDHVASALTLDRMTMALAGLCGLMAVLLASGGVYGVIDDAVRRRTREIGLRVALGADAGRVAGLVVLEVLSATGAGILLGFAVVLLLDRVVRVFVYGVPPLDVSTIAGTSAILAAVIAVATLPPLYRALRISPKVALQAQ